MSDPLGAAGLFSALGAFFGLVGGALLLQPEAFRAAEASPVGLLYALLILMLAGASHTLGQAVTLFFNRVSRRRFLLALAVGGLEFALEAGLWIASVWLLPRFLDPTPPRLATVTKVIGLAYAPILLSFLELAPYAGAAIGRALRVWALLAAIVGIAVVFDVRPWLAAAIAALGFVVQRVLSGLGGSVPARLEARFWRIKSGRQRQFSPADLLDLLRERQTGGPRG
jgi:hypothetical protein